MASGPKLVADRTEHGTEARGEHQALESLQPSLTLAHGVVRVLDSVVLAPAAEMGDARHDSGFRRGVARQPVGYDGARYHSSSPQELAKEALRGACAPTALNEDVEHLAGIIDGPPEPAAFPVDHQTEFIEVPDVRARPSRASQSSGVLHAEAQRPKADGFVRDLNPSGPASTRRRHAGSHRSGSRATRND